MLSKKDFLNRFAYMRKEKSLLEVFREHCELKIKQRAEKIQEIISFHEKNEFLLVQQRKERTLRSKSADFKSKKKIFLVETNPASTLFLKTPQKLKLGLIEDLEVNISQRSQPFIQLLAPSSPVFNLPCQTFRRKYRYKIRKEDKIENELDNKEKKEKFKRFLDRELSLPTPKRKIKVQNFLRALKE